MKVLSTEQIRELDAFTIANEPISSIHLMERAARVCVSRIEKMVNIREKILVVCGKGNNGGDGLAITRLLLDQGFEANALVIHYTTNFSADASTNYDLLKENFPENLQDIYSFEDLELLMPEKAVLIDAILGTGINKGVEGFLGEVIQYLNSKFHKIISIDVPSGLFCDKSSSENKNIIHSNLTLTFQVPKLAFFFAENKTFVPEFEILKIGLSEKKMQTLGTHFYYITADDIAGLLKRRSKFSHKGTYGHALLMAGSKGKSGAALLCAKACLKSGAGLLTVHSTKDSLTALLNYLPEAMSHEDANADHLTEVEKPELYDALAFGPGIGTHADTQLVLKKILNYYNGSMVIDADGLNILSENKTWLNFLRPETILTPHVKEFERLTEKQLDDFERLKAAKHFSLKHNCIVILKGAHSAIVMPDGNVFFNSSGNPGLAKGGSGDGLTGIILGLLSRGYSPPQAALIGTFIHGYAADLCTRKKSEESLLISDVIDMLPKAFKKLEVIKVD
jgi:ADP-dependent NAD(P)H-hydrate dehydratase / NAD(P)H-hydrate epimerase